MKKSSLYSLVFTIFNDGLGWGVVLTIFAPLLMDPNGPFFASHGSAAIRSMSLGLLIGSYALTQFFFMPIVGAFSDHWGRKKVLEGTILFAGASFALSAIAIWMKSLTLLFISRILSGIFSANASTAQAAIADISSEQQKTKNLSLAGIAGGLSWVIGPPLGGFLSSKKYVPWTDFMTPFWMVAISFFLNYVWIKRGFKETYIKTSHEHHDWKQEIKNLFKIRKIPRMAPWLTIAFFFYTGWGFYILFYPALLVQKFHFDQSAIGFLSGYLALFWLSTSLALNKGITQRFNPELVVLFFLPIMGVCSLLIAYVSSIIWWYLIFPFFAFSGASISISLLAFLSNLAGKENQGKVFGLAQSLQSLAMFVSPLIAGVLGAIDQQAPLTVGGALLIGTAVFATWYHFQDRNSGRGDYPNR